MVVSVVVHGSVCGSVCWCVIVRGSVCVVCGSVW